MTTNLQELGKRVAVAMGWREALFHKGAWFEDHAGSEVISHNNPSDPAECFKLCAEFDVWPVCDRECTWVFCNRNVMAIEHDNTPTSRLNAAIEAALLAVELIVKEGER